MPKRWHIWWRNWARITPFFEYPPEIRRVVYTTRDQVAEHESEEDYQELRLISAR